LQFFDVFNLIHLFVEQFARQNPRPPRDDHHSHNADGCPEPDIPGAGHTPEKDKSAERQGHDEPETGEKHRASGVILGPDVDIEFAQVFLVFRLGGVEKQNLTLAIGAMQASPERIFTLETKFDHNDDIPFKEKLGYPICG